MDRNYLLLLLLIVSLVQLLMLSHQRGEYRVMDFGETLQVKTDNIVEIEMSDFEGTYVSSEDPEVINETIDYFASRHYKRLVNDETSYMPLKTRMIYFREKNNTSYIIPYGSEVMIDHKVYSVKGEGMDESFFKHLYETMSTGEN